MDDASATSEMLDITPSPRVLEMLGEIEFAPWRCVAELVDNSVDGFLDVLTDGIPEHQELRVNVLLPRGNDPLATASLAVVDTGRGMSLGQVNDAVRAGWSGNDPFDNLGLFGMGFNIATARLGTRTRVLTTQRGQSEWYGVEIDLKKLQEENKFEVPIIREVKDDPLISGTRVTISRLRPGNYEDLSRNPRKLANLLGDAYAPLLLAHPAMELRVNNIRVDARHYCVWGTEREVKYGSGSTAEMIPARISFDEQLPDRAACRSCRRWQESPSVSACQFCGGNDLDVKSRRIRGWVGIQRYLHPSDYGIDFIRNGRKILIRDKSLFRWTDPNDVSGTEIIEYPVEPPANEGRIVGEIHIDHVPIEYRKETFRMDSPEWQAVRRFLRGDSGPMRPQARAERGMDRFANGPLSRLYRAFNANRPGARFLIPAVPDGPALHEKARDWGKRFHEGQIEYQSDDIWWKAVSLYERSRHGGVPGGEASDVVESDEHRAALVAIFGEEALAGTAAVEIAGLGASVDELAAVSDDEVDILPSHNSANGDVVETYIDRVDRYVATYAVIPDLNFQVALPGALQSVDLTTYLVDREEVRSETNERVPVHAFLAALGRLQVFVDANHPLFTHYDTQISDIVLAEVADLFRGRFDSTLTIGQIVARIKSEKMGDRRLDDGLAHEAEAALSRVRQGMQNVFLDQSEAFVATLAALNEADRAMAETSAASRENRSFEESVAAGTIVRHLPALCLPMIVASSPATFFDGKVFRGRYAGLGEAPQRLNVTQVVGYLYDLAVLADRPVRLRGQALRRAALSVLLIDDEIAGEIDSLQ